MADTVDPLTTALQSLDVVAREQWAFVLGRRGGDPARALMDVLTAGLARAEANFLEDQLREVRSQLRPALDADDDDVYQRLCADADSIRQRLSDE